MKAQLVLACLILLVCFVVPCRGQNVLLWNHSGSALLNDPERLMAAEDFDNSWVRPGYALQRALSENGCKCDVVEELPLVLDEYEIIFITLGYAILGEGCSGQGAKLKPAGVINPTELERLTCYLRSGKSLYVEGNDFLRDHKEANFFNLTGCGYIEDGGNFFQDKISALHGQNDTLFCEFHFRYLNKVEANESPDIMEAKAGELIFTSQDGQGRAVTYYDKADGHRVIVSSFVFGAVEDGNTPNTKKDLMRRYLSILRP